MDGERWVGMDSLRQKISGSKAYEMSFLQEANGLVCTDSNLAAVTKFARDNSTRGSCFQ